MFFFFLMRRRPPRSTRLTHSFPTRRSSISAQLIACVEAVAARIAKIPAPVLAMKKMSINRAMEAGGFLAAVNAVAESDAILHFEPAILELREALAQDGLRDTLASVRGQSSTELFRRFKGEADNGRNRIFLFQSMRFCSAPPTQ